MVNDDRQTVEQLPLFDGAQGHQMLREWNATETPYPTELCIHELFEAQVTNTPNATALVSEQQQVTYAGLNEQANRLAHYLREFGVRPDDRVALCVQRGLEMVVGLLGILKAGAAYVPLDPAYPSERLAHMLRDSEPKIVLTHSGLAGTLRDGFEQHQLTANVLQSTLVEGGLLVGDADRWQVPQHPG